MEIAFSIILIAGLIISGWYQMGRIKILERHLASQKSLLDRIKVYLDIFDPQEIQAWLKIREETIENENEVEIKRMQSWMEQLMKERFETGKSTEREIHAATDLITRSLFYAPPHIRKKSIEKMPNSMLKDAVRKVLDQMPEQGLSLAKCLPNSGNFSKNSGKSPETESADSQSGLKTS